MRVGAAAGRRALGTFCDVTLVFRTARVLRKCVIFSFARVLRKFSIVRSARISLVFEVSSKIPKLRNCKRTHVRRPASRTSPAAGLRWRTPKSKDFGRPKITSEKILHTIASKTVIGPRPEISLAADHVLDLTSFSPCAPHVAPDRLGSVHSGQAPRANWI